MPDYDFKVRSAAGELNSGTISAESASAAGALLRADGWFVVRLDQAVGHKRKASSKAAVHIRRAKIKRSQIISFAHQLAVMVDTGVPISEALHCIADQADTPDFQNLVREVASQVEAGGELSRALGKYPKVFPAIMISLVRASEVSGTMGPMLERVSQYLGKEAATYKKIKGALTYPAVMLVMVVLVTVGLLIWVLPKFATIFASKGAALPWPTRALMFTNDVMLNHWYFWIAGLTLATAGFFIGLKTR
ncbi:MAG: type II secretion system F family protein, partial [Planctomycetota bacterium]